MYAFFFFNDTATTEIYTLSLHDALPICFCQRYGGCHSIAGLSMSMCVRTPRMRSEEHTSELQSQPNLVCPLLLEKKKRHTRVLASTTPHPLSCMTSIRTYLIRTPAATTV